MTRRFASTIFAITLLCGVVIAAPNEDEHRSDAAERPVGPEPDACARRLVDRGSRTPQNFRQSEAGYNAAATLDEFPGR